MSQCGDDDEEQCASRLMPNISPATATAVRRWRESGDMVIVGDSPGVGPVEGTGGRRGEDGGLVTRRSFRWHRIP